MVSRAESTRELTVLAFSWLFVRRKCRVLADEVGLAGKANRFAGLRGVSHWRADAVGIAQIGNSYRIDVVEVKGSRADARREDMSSGKWELLPQGGRFNGWLLVSADCRPEDYKGLPLAWGVLQAAADASTLRMIRRPVASGMKDHGEILLSAAEIAPDLFAASYRTLASRLPYLGRSVPEAVAAFHTVEDGSIGDFLNIDLPEPLPAQIPGAPGEVKILDVDDARLYPFSATVDIQGLGLADYVAPIRGLDGKIIGYGDRKSVV